MSDQKDTELSMKVVGSYVPRILREKQVEEASETKQKEEGNAN